MRVLSRISFKQKLTLSAMVISGVALLLAAAAFTTYEVVVFRRSMLADLQRTARMVGDNSAAALAFRDPGSALLTLGSLSANPHIIAAAIYDDNGGVFATYTVASGSRPRRFPAVEPDLHRIGDNELELFHTITVRDDKAGTVYLVSDLEEMRERLWRYAWILAAVVIMSSLGALALAHQVHKTIADPLVHLSTVATRIAAEKNYSVRAHKESADELGRLVDAFNEMLTQIQERDAALQRAHESLEKRVVERTQQLSDEVSERRRSEAALRESNLRFEIVTRTTTDAIWDWDPVTNAIWWSDNFRVVFGHSPGEATSFEGWLALVHEADAARVEASVRAVAAGSSHVWTSEYRFRCADGTYSVVVDRGYVVRGEDGRAVRMIGALQDVTAQRAAEVELRRTHGELVDASRRAGQAEVATSVLHNVGNVLNSVIVSATVAMDRARGLRTSNIGRIGALLQEHRSELGAFFSTDPKGRVLLDYLPQLTESLEADRSAVLAELGNVARNVEHIKEIVTRQQSVARSVGVLEIVPMVEIVEHALALNREIFAARGIIVERRFGDVPVFPVDKHRLTQILVNLIRNAHDALQETALPRRVEVELGCIDAVVRVRVSDNGVGIAAENLTRIFQHGFTTRRDGHGFGLHSGAIAARDLGGRLSVSSDGPGRGATFVLDFPFKPSPSC